MPFTNHQKFSLLICFIGSTLFLVAVVIVTIKGSKIMSTRNFVKGHLFWPDVYGDKVPIAARRAKIIVITFAVIAFTTSLLAILSVFGFL
jgi:hypothetical protein